MKSSEASILVIPGWSGAGEAHWQSRLIAKLPSAVRVEQADWNYGSLPAAIANIVAAVAKAPKPVVFITHSAGGIVLAHAVDALRSAGLLDRVKGAFIVAPPSDGELAKLAGLDPAIVPAPRAALPFKSVLVSSSDDPHCTVDEAKAMAEAWGADFVDAGPAGHINTASGHGPWPEGLMRFAGFLSKL